MPIACCIRGSMTRSSFSSLSLRLTPSNGISHTCPFSLSWSASASCFVSLCSESSCFSSLFVGLDFPSSPPPVSILFLDGEVPFSSPRLPLGPYILPRRTYVWDPITSWLGRFPKLQPDGGNSGIPKGRALLPASLTLHVSWHWTAWTCPGHVTRLSTRVTPSFGTIHCSLANWLTHEAWPHKR